jgi:hypothetical protein
MANVREIAQLIEQYAGSDGVHTTAIPRLILYRASSLEGPMYASYESTACIVAQGRKQSIAGDGIYLYHAEKYLTISVGVPAVGRVLDASPKRPFLCLALAFDPAIIASLLLDLDQEQTNREQPGSALAVGAVQPEMLDACARLLRLQRNCRLLGWAS